MARRTSSNGSVWFNKGTIVNVFAIPVLTAAITLGGAVLAFYFQTKELPGKIAEETKAREALRTALVENTQKTQQAISELATQQAVATTQIQSLTSTLDRVVSGLQNVELSLAGGHPAERRTKQ